MTQKITLVLMLFIAVSSLTFGQEKFIYDQEGLNPKYVVVEIASRNQNELFKRSINWIKETYKNPEKVIKTTIDNEKVRFEGFKDNLICVNPLGIVYCYYALYTIQIEFKNNKYKFTPLNLEYRVPASQYWVGGMISINFSDGSAYYNQKRKLKKMYKNIPLSIEMLFNELNFNLSKYLSIEKEKNDSDDW